jgi:hypothetical protein
VTVFDDDDELPHAPGADPDWQESWSIEATSRDGLAICAQLTLWPAARRAWWWTAVLTPDAAGPVLVRDLEVALPRARALEVHSEGLWAEIVCETPHEHWSVGLEAFGVRLDDPVEAYTGERGDRLPVGLDLEFEASTPVLELPAPDDEMGYAQGGTVHGEVLLGRSALPIDARGIRTHAWGRAHWWSTAQHRAVCLVDPDEIVFVREGARASAALRWREPAHRDVASAVHASHHYGADGLPAASRITIDSDLELDVEVEGLAPLLVEAPDGRRARFTRACCRFGLRDGSGDREGHGWADWLAPVAGARG